MIRMNWTVPLIGIPWQINRPGPGSRCWTLVAMGMLATGVSVPDYEGSEASASELRELHTLRAGVGEWPWMTIVDRNESDRAALAAERGREFDVVVFRGRGLHAGLLTDRKGEMLHVEQGSESCLTNFWSGVDAARWRPRLLALYRHEALA